MAYSEGQVILKELERKKSLAPKVRPRITTEESPQLLEALLKTLAEHKTLTPTVD